LLNQLVIGALCFFKNAFRLSDEGVIHIVQLDYDRVHLVIVQPGNR
jgi:hypothetical protein